MIKNDREPEELLRDVLRRDRNMHERMLEHAEARHTAQYKPAYCNPELPEMRVPPGDLQEEAHSESAARAGISFLILPRRIAF
jgi:hypothetical protein